MGQLNAFLAEDAGGDAFHELAEKEKEEDGGNNSDNRGDEAGFAEINEVEEAVGEGDEIGANNNAEDGGKEAGAEEIERFRDAVDEDEVDSEGSENGDCGELVDWEDGIVG